jgi:hypothetical protein
MGLFSLLMIALLQLLDTSTSLWKNVDTRRERTEASGGIGERIAMDLSTLESGAEGDFLADWGLIDVDGDGVPTLPLARMRFVRRASSAELGRLSERRGLSFTEQELAELEGLEEDMAAEGEPTGLEDWGRMNRGLVEVTWLLSSDEVPVGLGEKRRFRGKLLRGMRTVDDPTTVSFFDERMLGPGGRPGRLAAPAISAVGTGVLWMGLEFATQMTITDADFSKGAGASAWAVGDLPRDGAQSWDAWNKRRPDMDVTDLNEPGAGMGQLSSTANNPLLPRRVRIILEVQPERDVTRRTTLRASIDHVETQLTVADGQRLPEVGAHLLLDEEWMKLLSVNGDRIRVERAKRGTLGQPHQTGGLVQYGWSMSREVPIGVFREDWDL